MRTGTLTKGQELLSIFERLKLKLPAILLIVLMIFGAILRFYRLGDLMVFVSDQSRDVMVVQSMIKSRIPTLVGPASSEGSFHRGPIYYYILLPAVLIGRGNPVSAAAFIGIVDLVTLYLLYSVGRSYFGIWAGLSAAALWATAPMIITFARWIWNPNLLPVLVLLMMKSMMEIARGKSQYLILLASAWIIAWQLHDQALFLLPVMAAFALTLRPSIPRRIYCWTLFSASLLLLPYLLDEILHSFANTVAMARYVFRDGTSNEGFLSKASTRLFQVFHQLDSSVVPASGYLHIGFQLLLVAGLLQLLRFYKNEETRNNAIIFFFWLVTPLLYVFWPGQFYAHYLEILFPAIFLLSGLGILALRKIHLWIGYSAMVLLMIFVLFTGYEQMKYFRQTPPGPGTFGATKAVVEHILKKVNGNPFAFQLITREGHPYDALPYFYLFSRRGTPPVKRVDVEKFTVYDPNELPAAAGENGIVIHGLRIVELPPPIVGANLIQPHNFVIEGTNRFRIWILSRTGAALDASSGGDILILEGRSRGPWIGRSAETPATEWSFAKRLLRVQGNREYVVRFDHRVLMEPGSPRVSIQLLDDQRQTLNKSRNQYGVLEESQRRWSTFSFRILTPPDAKYAWLWLANGDAGKIAYRNVEVRIIKKQKDEAQMDDTDH